MGSVGRPFAAGASAGSTDAGACSVRAAARIADSDDGFDSDAATAAGSESSDSSVASHCPLDAAVRTDREVSALARLVPETVCYIFVNDKSTAG